MAESIVIHFCKATWQDLTTLLEQIAEQISSNRWGYPRQEDYDVFVYEYDGIINEYEDDKVDFLYGYFNNFPKSTLCIQLRRIKGNDSCDTAEKLTTTLLEKFEGIAYDTYSNFWTLEEIKVGTVKETGKFLDFYRINPSCYLS